MGRMKGMVAAAVVAACVAGSAARPAHAVEGYVNDAGIGVATVFANLLYMPAKFTYATLGGLTGGFAFVLTAGRMDVASAIWIPSLGGTYVLTPSMVRGEDPVYFSGASNDGEGDRAEREDDRREEFAPRSEPPAEGY